MITDEQIEAIRHEWGDSYVMPEVRTLLQALSERTTYTEATHGPVLSSEINALPDRLRSYIHDLETRADPAGDVRRAFVAEEKAMALEVRVQEFQQELAELRKPVAVEKNAAIESIRPLIGDAGNVSNLPALKFVLAHYDALAEAHAVLAQDNARWVRARDAREAEMRGLRERIAQMAGHAEQHVGYAEHRQAELDASRERERQLREALERLSLYVAYNGDDWVQKEALSALAASPSPASFQQRVDDWMQQCFGPEISADRQERSHRFLEEALELVQAAECTQHEAQQLVAYVYGRPAGLLEQEIGGAVVTLHALCSAWGKQVDVCGEIELQRVWGLIDRIREKHRAKPKFSPLPVAVDHEGVAVYALPDQTGPNGQCPICGGIECRPGCRDGSEMP